MIPLDRHAFRRNDLEHAIEEARRRLEAARATVMVARGKLPKLKARRAVRVASAALSDAEAALTREDVGEKLSPAVQRAAIVHNDTVIREARVVITPGKRAELQPALERLRARGGITERCYRAGRRYRDAWERAGRDAFPVGLGGDGGGNSAPASGNRRIEEAVGNGVDLQAARHAIGRFGTAILEHLIIEGLTLNAWAERQGKSEHVAKGVLEMVLERLAEHWTAHDAADAAQNAAEEARSRIRSLHGTL